ncbi:feruloyl-CoA synthase [Nannocystis bainbridge]|uniref:Feruloyl-CoA synthase n=1 Tax=Nannocystis bainbridge TaxID=2995303 RepID=A0ABT5EBK4_9BACT|nr:feruloyl-CoA synthase [Nannocystis bainbridge]MDC0723250.1 feruloyl-CoA synthase [Nannocystis bainbridge]
MTDPQPLSLALAPAEVVVTYREGGVMELRSPQPLQPYPATLAAALRRWAEEAPERVLLGERRDGQLFELTYGAAWAQIRRLGAALLARGLSAARPLLLLSDNSVDNALLQLAAMYVGVPAVPVSPAYSLVSQDLENLRHIAAQVEPGLVFAADGARFARALAAVGAPAVVGQAPGAGHSVLEDMLSETCSLDHADAAHAATGPDTVAKILFTSGSTSRPKGVVNTQRMLCSNQQAIAQCWPFLRARPPVLVDWLPWHHTFGGNHNFNMALFHGGSLYLDEGKPAPGLIERTVANLRAVPPTLYFNVPRGFEVLLPHLERDAELRERFFSRLDVIFYAGAALPPNLWARLVAVAEQAGAAGRVLMASAWGSTETSPLVTSVHFSIEHAGIIGLPAPGCELKLVPREGKLELRVRGPNVTPGYHREPELTAAAFDDEGYYCIGDAGRLADPTDPRRGVVFDGRVAEDFKLTSGTWVSVGALRVAFIAAAAPVVQDVVIAGEGRTAAGALIFLNPDGCRALAPDVPADRYTDDPRIRAHLAAALAAHNAANPTGSRLLAAGVVLAEPPAIDAGEITDKGYINQRAVLRRRAADVARLYASPPDPARVDPA